jgi:hypothetical protein
MRIRIPGNLAAICQSAAAVDREIVQGFEKLAVVPPLVPTPRAAGMKHLAKKRGGDEAKRHDERMKSARYKLEAFIRDYFDMAEWKELCEAIKKQLGAKHV